MVFEKSTVCSSNCFVSSPPFSLRCIFWKMGISSWVIGFWLMNDPRWYACIQNQHPFDALRIDRKMCLVFIRELSKINSAFVCVNHCQICDLTVWWHVRINIWRWYICALKSYDSKRHRQYLYATNNHICVRRT